MVVDRSDRHVEAVSGGSECAELNVESTGMDVAVLVQSIWAPIVMLHAALRCSIAVEDLGTPLRWIMVQQ